MRIATCVYPESFKNEFLGRSTCGKPVWLTPNEHGELTIEVELALKSSISDDLPVDAIACSIWLPDQQGRVWRGTALVTSELLVDCLATANFENLVDYWHDENIPRSIQSLFDDTPLLTEIRYSSDDRFYRSLRLGESWAQAIFKYSVLIFDLAVAPDSIYGQKFFARLREGGSYDKNIPLNEIHYTDDLPCLVFELSNFVRRIMHENGAVLSEYGNWSPTLFPQPLEFTLTDESPNPDVSQSVVEVHEGMQ